MKTCRGSEETEVKLKDFKHPWNILNKTLDKKEKVCIIDESKENSCEISRRICSVQNGTN